MFVDPSIRLELARLRNEELLATSERHRLAKAALACRQDDRGRRLTEPPVPEEPSLKRIIRPRQANA